MALLNLTLTLTVTLTLTIILTLTLYLRNGGPTRNTQVLIMLCLPFGSSVMSFCTSENRQLCKLRCVLNVIWYMPYYISIDPVLWYSRVSCYSDVIFL